MIHILARKTLKWDRVGDLLAFFSLTLQEEIQTRNNKSSFFIENNLLPCLI